MRTSFITYFTSCYGLICLNLAVFSFIVEVRVDIGFLGFLGFLLVSLIYAIIRCCMDSTRTISEDKLDVVKSDTLYASFIAEDESRIHLYKEDLIRLFYMWKDERSSL